MPKLTETAVLIVNGKRYDDWETVMVVHELNGKPPYRFKFTCSEGMPLAKDYAKLRIKPGDVCQVWLADHHAITGYVTTRQVYYDAHRHHIEIQGATYADQMSRVSWISKGLEYKDIPLPKLIQEGVNQVQGLKLSVEGGAIPGTVYPRVNIAPSQTPYDVIEPYAREHGLSFTSNKNGDFVVAVGPLNGKDALIEGKNILEGREVIQNLALATEIAVSANRPGDDQTNGPQVTHVPFVNEVAQMLGGASPGWKRPRIVVKETPGWTQDLVKGRVGGESKFNNGESVTVICTVHGWLKPSGGLWERNITTYVKSPMLIMDETLKTRMITFTQDNARGSRTAIELVNDMVHGGPARSTSNVSGA